MKLKLVDGLSLPLEAVTEKFAWLGRTGSGKTYGAMKLAELMLEAGAQIGAIDPVGVWRALRVPATKDGQSFEVVVFGGLYGDLPLEPTAAAAEIVADLVVERGLSFVLDISQWIPREQQTFLQGFTHRFFHLKKSKPSAVHLFMEECQEYIPENPSGVEAITLGHMQRLWKLGRNFGIGGSLISQRPQEIAKKALNMSGTLFAFQMTGPQERKAIKAWVADQGIAVDIESILQKLEVGSPHVESPMFLEVSKTVQILPRVTADLSSTPKVGASTVAKRPLTPIDVEQLKTSLAATIEKAKADDPRELRRQIAELKKQVAKGAPQANPKTAAIRQPKTVERFVLKDGQLARLEKAGESVGELSNRLFDLTEKVQALWKDIKAAVAQTRQPPEASVRPSTTTRQTTRQPLPAQAPRSVRPVVQAADRGDGYVPGRGGDGRMLAALAQFPDGMTDSKLAILAGMTKRGGAFRTYLSKLRVAGYVEGDRARLRITPSGQQAAGDVAPLPTGDALLDYWRADLGDSGARKIFDVLVEAYPEAMPKADVAVAASMEAAGGAFRTYVSKLRVMGLIQGSGELRAANELFD